MEEVWNRKLGQYVELPKELQKFYDELDHLCKKYNLSLAHEDGMGSFIIEEYDERNISWIKNANIDIDKLHSLHGKEG